MKWILKIVVIFFLTVITQVGGIIYVIHEYVWVKLRKHLNSSHRSTKRVSFVLCYTLVTFLIVPPLAKIGNRKALPVFETNALQPLNIATCFLNRHYVTLELYETIISTSVEMGFEGTTVNYLDANFPFYDGFPLIPHLSHNDGKKLDLAFCYLNAETKKKSKSAPSFIGYGVSEGPEEGQVSTAKFCDSQGYWHYGLLNHLIPQSSKDDYIFDNERTKLLIQFLLKKESISKIFIEPHLIERMNLNHDKLRFHGCHAVRHDDHIHIQLK